MYDDVKKELIKTFGKDIVERHNHKDGIFVAGWDSEDCVKVSAKDIVEWIQVALTRPVAIITSGDTTVFRAYNRLSVYSGKRGMFLKWWINQESKHWFDPEETIAFCNNSSEQKIEGEDK